MTSLPRTLITYIFVMVLVIQIHPTGPGRDAMPVVQSARFLWAGVYPFSESAQAVMRDLFIADGQWKCLSCGKIGMTYPLTAAIVALPFGLLPYDRGEWAFCAVGLLLLMLFLRLLCVPLWVLTSIAVLSAINVNNPILMTTALIGLGLVLSQRRPVWAGVLLGLALLIKPQSGLLLVGYVLWQTPDWRRAVLSMLTTGALVGGLSVLIAPRWIGDWLAQVQLYRSVEAAALQSFPYMLPLALWIILRRAPLGGVALAQTSLIPAIAVPYSFLPLIIFAAPHLRAWALVSLCLVGWTWSTINGYAELSVPNYRHAGVLVGFVLPAALMLSVPLFLKPTTAELPAQPPQAAHSHK